MVAFHQGQGGEGSEKDGQFTRLTILSDIYRKTSSHFKSIPYGVIFAIF
jgi:hypothetical protein